MVPKLIYIKHICVWACTQDEQFFLMFCGNVFIASFIYQQKI